MKHKTPGRAVTRHRGEIGKPDSTNLVPNNQNFKTPDLATRKRFLHLGRELHRRGEFPTAQFCAELADLPNADEVLGRLEDFCRISVAQYIAVDADSFPSYLVPLDGGRR